MQRKVYLKLTELEAAKELWLKRVGSPEAFTLPEETIPLAEAQGRILSRPAVARLSSPAFHGAAMDGIAVDAKDTYGASEFSPKELTIGETAFWINTGHPLPEHTNAVIMIENVTLAPGSPSPFAERLMQQQDVRHEASKTPVTPAVGRQATDQQVVSIEKAAFPWQHVRKLGEDIVATEILLPPGTRISAYEIGALAAAGLITPYVFKKPRVAIIPSGSELVPLIEATEELLASGKALPEFNSLVLAAMVRDAGGEPVILPIVDDAPEQIRKALVDTAEGPFDLVVINAGSSAGSHDYTAEIIAEAGELLVHGVTVMPGKPTALGIIRNTPVLGVPGYPVSAIIAFEEFGQPLLTHWQKRAMPERPMALAVPFNALPSKAGMEERVRVKLGRVGDTLMAVPLPRGAGTVTSLSRADGIITIPANVEGIPSGREVAVTLLHERAQVEGAILAIGSHDNTLDLIDSYLRKMGGNFSLTSAHVGSLGGLMALKEGRCHVAGSHLLDHATGVYNKQAIKEHLSGIPVMVMRLVDREQGLIIPAGNPLDIKGLSDLTRPDLTFINRQRGSGTRVLLDWQLKDLGIKPSAVTGYENEEYTHMSVAAAVLSGRASCGLGVRAAANALGLDFIPVGVEEYDLIIPRRYYESPRIQALCSVVADKSFKEAVAAMGGYGVEQTGTLVWEWNG